MNLVMNKEDLLKQLKARRDWARARDREATRIYKEQEKAELKRFREALREALKWDAKEAAKNTGYRGKKELEFNSPPCSLKTEIQLDRAISTIEMDNRKKFTLDSGNSFAKVYRLLTDDDIRAEC